MRASQRDMLFGSFPSLPKRPIQVCLQPPMAPKAAARAWQPGMPPRPSRQSSSNFLNVLRDRSTSFFGGSGIPLADLPKDVRIGSGQDEATFAVVTGEIPKELADDLQRDFTPAEVATILSRVHKTLAPSVKQPGALFVFGPSAVGKTVFVAAQVCAPHFTTACLCATVPRALTTVAAKSMNQRRRRAAW